MLEQLETRLVPAALTGNNQLVQAYGQLPLSFEANQGQAGAQVDFLSRGNGYALFLSPGQAILSLDRSTGSDGIAARDVVTMQLIGANPAAQAAGLDQQPGITNYFIGNDPRQWRTDIPNYGRVEYRDVYPGINEIYYDNQRQLEYDFQVAPGADPGTIRISFTGAQGISIDSQGDLDLHTVGGDVVERAPFIYQETSGARRSVAGRYVLEGNNQVGFRMDSFDRSRTLVIDPVLSYSTYLGGSHGIQGNPATDAGYAITVDGSGNAYVTGTTFSSDFPTDNPFQPTNHGIQTAFVAKMNTSGTALVYSTYLGGSGGDIAQSIAVDVSGNAYVTGQSWSIDFPTVNGSPHGNFDNGSVFIAKLNASGTALVYSTCLGGAANSQGQGIAVDSSGNAYVGGWSYGAFPTVNALQPSSGGNGDAIVVKLNSSGATVYSTYLGGASDDYAFGIAVDTSGDAYVTGSTFGQFPVTTGAFQTAFGGGPFPGDVFVAELNASDTALVYSTYLGGTSDERAHGIALDNADDTYVTGYTTSSDFPITTGAFQTALGNTGGNAFVTELNASGTALVYSTYLGGSDGFGDAGSAIAVDRGGNAYVTGLTYATNFPLTADAIVTTLSGNDGNGFVTELNASGSDLVYSSYLGGTGQHICCSYTGDEGFGIALDSADSIYLTGVTDATDFPTTAGAFQTRYGGGGDAFIMKISFTGSISGHAFNDVNGDGTQDSGEPALQNWTVFLDTNNNGVPDPGEPATRTDATGAYSFADLQPDSYLVREVLPNGWIQTTPNPAPVTVSDTTSATGVDFGNFENISLTGRVFEDTNGNGALDPGESGLANWMVFMDVNNDGNPDPGDPTTTTDSSGNFSFSNLGPGSYTIREVHQNVWLQTSTNPVPITALSGQNVSNVNFGNFRPASLSGQVFEDLNGNGMIDPEDHGLANWIVFLDTNNDGILDDNERSTTTDANGNYSFGNLAAGNYLVREMAPDGWTTTTTGQTIVPTSGGNVTGVNLGTFRLIRLSGDVFQDANGNGVLDSGESGLAGWTMFLDQNHNGMRDPGEPTATTDPAGNFVFTGVGPGTYRLREVSPNGWLQTTADPGDIAASSGTDVSGSLFGDFQRATVSGQVFNDLNADGVHDSGEPGLPHWTMFLDTNNNGNLDPGEQSTMTDANGNFAFGSLGPGSYSVRQVIVNGWSESTVNPAPVTLTSGGNISSLAFGNFQGASIRGQVFEDTNGNGVKDSNDPGLAGWAVFLDGNGNNVLDPGEPSVSTDAGGNYSFTPLHYSAGRLQ
jgi:protocatechuate 3,4-dioxygenase beta subunit